MRLSARRRLLGGASLAVVLVLIGSSATWLGLLRRRSAPTTFVPVADAYVTKAHPETNYGSSTTLRTDATPRIRSYLRFTVSGLPGEITKATLRVWSRSSDPVGSTVHPVSSPTWDERKITFATAPKVGPASAPVGPFRADEWASADVTSLVTGAGEVSFALTSTSPHDTSYDSREGAHEPELVVETDARREVTGAQRQASLPELIEDVPRSTGHRYNARDDRGNTLDGLKVVENPAGGYLGVYHQSSEGVFSTMVATSTDLLHWTYRATLGSHASQPTIAAAGGGFVVAAEMDDSGLAHPVSRGLRFWYYATPEALLEARADRTFDAPRTLVAAVGGFEGTPNIYSVGLSPDLDHSSIDVGFHYYQDGVDRQGRGTLVGFSAWAARPEPLLQAAVEAHGVMGNVGDRDAVSYRGADYTLIEGQLARGDFGSWRTFLFDPRRNRASQVQVRTHKGSTAFANPTVTSLRSPSGRPALVVTMFIPAQGAAPGEAGELVYFVEQRAKAARPDPVIAAAGDIACRKPDESPGGCRERATSDLLLGIAPAAVLPLGDTQYETGTLAGFEASYDLTWGRLKAISHPTAGNHEYKSDPAAGYYAYFGEAAGDPAKGYYSFDIGAWHLVSLNSNCTPIGGCGAGSPQLEWLRADLEANARRCTLAYWHQPRFSSGEHGSDAAFADFWRVLYDAGADVVLSGHDHDYERFAPQDPDGRADPDRGIRQFVVGTGGKNLDPFHQIQPNSEVRGSEAFGVLQLTLHADSYDWRFVPEPGQTFTDTGRGACH